MRDLTQGSITAHLVGMSAFIGATLLVQTLYFVVDLYFVSRLGSAAVAGVSAAGNAFFLAMAAAQLIAVGVMALVSQAVGRKDEAEANLYSDQALSLSLVFALATLVIGYTLGGAGVAAMTADVESAAAGRAFLFAMLPSLALLFPINTMVSALRGAGVVTPIMALQTATIFLNIVLCPILITGWGPAPALGVAGAGLASSIASAVGGLGLVILFPRVQSYLRMHSEMLKPKLEAWRRIIFIGLPSSVEFGMMFIIVVVIYWVIRHFGAEAQAGYGIAMRVMQSIFLPAMAVSFAAAPIAGQNFGAGRHDRVRETFKQAVLLSTAIMLTLTVLCHIAPEALARPFSSDPRVLFVSNEYLVIASWNFVASGLIMCASSMFQGMGHTRPSLLASASRLVTFAAPAIWLSFQPALETRHIWYLSAFSITLQAGLAMFLLWRTFKTKLKPA